MDVEHGGSNESKQDLVVYDGLVLEVSHFSEGQFSVVFLYFVFIGILFLNEHASAVIKINCKVFQEYEDDIKPNIGHLNIPNDAEGNATSKENNHRLGISVIVSV